MRDHSGNGTRHHLGRNPLIWLGHVSISAAASAWRIPLHEGQEGARRAFDHPPRALTSATMPCGIPCRGARFRSRASRAEGPATPIWVRGSRPLRAKCHTALHSGEKTTTPWATNPRGPFRTLRQELEEPGLCGNVWPTPSDCPPLSFRRTAVVGQSYSLPILAVKADCALQNSR
jgi:hypothetical protein